MRGGAVLGNEAFMSAHLLDGPANQRADTAEEFLELLSRQIVGERVMTQREDSLPQHHLQPGLLGEELFRFTENLPGGTEDFKLPPQLFRRR